MTILISYSSAVAEKKNSWEHWILSTKENLKKKNFNQKTINYLNEIKFNLLNINIPHT